MTTRSVGESASSEREAFQYIDSTYSSALFPVVSRITRCQPNHCDFAARRRAPMAQRIVGDARRTGGVGGRNPSSMVRPDRNWGQDACDQVKKRAIS
jgi:hypothetical protein